MNYEKILVTGGAGFIGSSLCKKLESLDKEVYIFDNGFRMGFSENYENNNHLHLIKGNLINLDDWKSQQKALSEIHRILKKDGYYIMLECFNDGLQNLNSARISVGLTKIKPPWHNLYFDKKQLIKVFQDKFVDGHSLKKDNYINFDNFLSSYFFGSRVLYPALSAGKKDITYNNGFVKFFSQIPSYGYYSQIQLCVIQKI